MTQSFQSQNISSNVVSGTTDSVNQSMVGYPKIWAGTNFILWETDENADNSKF